MRNFNRIEENESNQALTQITHMWKLGAEKFERVMEKIENSEFVQGVQAENAKFKKSMGEVAAKRSGNVDILEQIKSILDGEVTQEQQSKVTEWLFGPKDKYKKELSQYAKYMKDKTQIDEMYKDEPEKLSQASFLYDLLKGKNKKGKNSSSTYSSGGSSTGDDGFMGEFLKTASGELSDGLNDALITLITDFDNFGDSFKKIGVNMLQGLLSQSTNMLVEQLINKENTEAAVGTIKAAWEWMEGVFKSLVSSIGNLMGSLGGGAGGLFSTLFGGAGGGEGFVHERTWWEKFKQDVLHIGVKFHSGGVVPSSDVGYELPGTQEQLALLKGGERVLSPSENVQYNRENERGSKVNFINFNVKAWDSKDVQKFLIENKNLLNQITFQGIKDNNQMLRQIVRNA